MATARLRIIGSVYCVMLPANLPAGVLTTSMLSPEDTTNRRCVSCGTIKKSGKHSCCARGGSWFKNCGNVGDTKFDHTWFEGILACGLVSDAVQVPGIAFLIRMKATNDTHNTTRKQANINSALTTDPKDCVVMVKVVVVCICVLFIV